jgi:hypothetical protein
VVVSKERRGEAVLQLTQHRHSAPH